MSALAKLRPIYHAFHPARLFDRLIVKHCVLCGITLKHKQSLCSDCLADLPYLGEQAIELSSANYTTYSGKEKEHSHLPFDHIYCEFEYRYPINQMVTRLKFGKQLIYADILGEALAHGLKHHEIPIPDALLPVPLHNKRLRSRGFNQAHEIAKAINKTFDKPILTKAVKRKKSTLAQSGLDYEQRQYNIADSFTCQSPLKYQHIAIIDDVMTTGSTLLELATLLKQHHVETISLWVCAHSQLHKP